MTDGSTIAFFPEAAYGPALNSVGIAQAVEALGHEAVFLSDPSMAEVFEGYGFETYEVNMSDPSLSPEEKAKYWDDFINKHIPNFDRAPEDQLDNYVKECWEAIVETAEWSQQDLPGALEAADPDVVCLDNVMMVPAIKNHGVPWVRITSCSENEIPDPAIPPYLSGCRADAVEAHHAFESTYKEVIGPVHDDYNDFLEEHGLEPYPRGLFLEPSPYLNLIKYPERLRWDRWNELDPARFQYLNGCVREEPETYDVPAFDGLEDAPLLYLSFGSLGAGDTELMRRLIGFLGDRPYRCLVNVGDYLEAHDEAGLPANVVVDSWFPQQSVIEQADVVIHHGGNNTFNECLYYGTPAVVMPYVWDGHDNATRVDETGHGVKLHRSDWSEDELEAAIERCLGDETIQANVAETARDMQASDGARTAAERIDELLRTAA